MPSGLNVYSLLSTESFRPSHRRIVEPEDPISARWDRALESLSHVGLVTGDDLEPFQEEVRKKLHLDELNIVRVIHATIQSADDGTRSAMRVIFGGFRIYESGIVDAVVEHIDNEEGIPSELSDEARRFFGHMSFEDNSHIWIRPGEGGNFEEDIYELLVAGGRNEGVPVRDLYRPLGEQPVNGVRVIESLIVGPELDLAS